MLTNPNTLGLFDANIEEIATIVHGVGATLYYDGANLNAVMGRTRPGDMGFDIVHFNLHKSFTQPHGGGGPGAGPDRGLRPHRALPAAPAGRRRAAQRHGTASTSTTTGRSRSGACAASRATTASFVRSYAYILLARRRRPAGRVRDRGAERQLPARAAAASSAWPSTCRPPTTALCMHEFVLSGAPMKRDLGSRRSTSPSGCSTTASTRRPSTSRCWSTRRCWSSRPRPRRRRRSTRSPRRSRDPRARPPRTRRSRCNAPYTTPVRRLDEAGAAKRPVIRQTL